MMNLFSKDNEDNQKNNPSEEAVIIEGDFASGEEYGSEEERIQLEELETVLAKTLEKTDSEMDGHDLGDASFTIYLYGTSADTIFEKIEDILKRSDFDYLQITKRYGSAEEPSSQEKKFTL